MSATHWATKDGRVLAWSDIDDRHLWNIVRMRVREVRAYRKLARSDLLPTVEDLRVAWDRACGGNGGLNHADDPEKRPWCLVELWVGYRGVPTTTPEWLAA